MASLGIDGLVSGLDTTSLINSLIQADSGPQTLLKKSVSTSTTLLADLRTLNTYVTSLGDAAKAASLPGGVNVFRASATSSTVTATASSTAAPGSLSLGVTRVAQTQVAVTGASASWAAPAVFTVVGADGIAKEVTAPSGSAADVADALTAADIGISAVRVAAGTDGSGTALYRLQLTSTRSGAAGSFSLYSGTAADVAAGTATDLLAAPGAAIVTAAQDASVTLWKGSAAEQVITSSTNTFSGILPGVDVTISKVEADPVTITVARDDAKISSTAANLITSLGTAISFLDTRSAISSSTNAAGRTVTTGGSFSGESLTRDIRSELFAAASQPVNGLSPATIGINVTRDGTVTFDAAAFNSALAKDPAGTRQMFQDIAARLTAAAATQTDKTSGSITARITGETAVVTDLGTRIEDWDRRLEARRASLQSTYAALETQLSALKTQSTWLTSQLAGLAKSSS